METTKAVQVVAQDRFDRRTFRELYEASSEIRNLAGNEPVRTALMRDIWAAYFKTDPELVDPADLKTAYQPNHALVSRMMETQDYQQTRLMTVLDDLAAAVATTATAKALLDEIANRPELQEAYSKAAAGDQEAADEAIQYAARAFRRIAKEATAAAQQEAGQIYQILAGYGLEPADLKKDAASLQDRLELVKRLKTSRMKVLSDMIGRMRNLAKARSKTKANHSRDEIHSITLGNDLEHILPAELAQLKRNRLDFYRRFTEKQLIEYELKAREPQGKGPMVILVDCSGSMAGHRFYFAAAVSMALVDLAQKEKRQSRIIFFNTRNIYEIEIGPKEKSLETILEIARIQPDGGTRYEPPLEEALRILTQEAQYKQADVVMITDGECSLNEDVKKNIKEHQARTGTKFIAVLIGSQPVQLREWADPIFPILDLLDQDQIGGLYEVL